MNRKPAPSKRFSRDGRNALGLGLISFLLGAPGALRYNLTWDEPTYFHFARLQRGWFADLLDPSRWGDVFSAGRIHDVWLQDRYLNGHPPFTEIWQALAGLPFHLAGAHDTQGFRLSMSLMTGLTAGLFYLLCRRGFSVTASLAGVLALLGVPAVWAHGHLGATEMTQLLFWILLALLAQPALAKGRRTMILWLLASAFAFLAKFTNILIPIWIVGTAGILGAYRRRRFWILALTGLAVGPFLILLLDPYFWPWQGGWARFVDYIGQVGSRSEWVPLQVFYLGKNWGFQPPWHYRIVELAAALPLAVLVLFLPGAYFCLRSLVRQIRRREIADWPSALGITGLAGALIAGWFPGSPNHDNTRQFIYVFVPVALISAAAVERGLGFVKARFAKGAGAGLGRALLAPALLAFGISLWAEPWGLSYHSEWLGGVKGAWAKGFEVCYWGEAVTPKMMAALSELGRRRGRIPRVVTIPKFDYFAHGEDFWSPMLPEEARSFPIATDVRPAFFEPWIPAQIRGPALLVTAPDPTDAILVFYRRAMTSEDLADMLEWLRSRGDLQLLEESRIEGVPLARLYAINDQTAMILPGDPERKPWYAPSSLKPAGPDSP